VAQVVERLPTKCKALSSNSSTANKKIHNRERPYKYNGHEKIFISSTFLVRHQKAHTSERPLSEVSVAWLSGVAPAWPRTKRRVHKRLLTSVSNVEKVWAPLLLLGTRVSIGATPMGIQWTWVATTVILSTKDYIEEQLFANKPVTL
jgi:hypothetical protein